MNWGTVELEPEVRDWLEELDTAQFATTAFYIDLLAEQGVHLGEPYMRQLDGKLRELRFHLDGNAVCEKSGRSTEHVVRCGVVSSSSTPLMSATGSDEGG